MRPERRAVMLHHAQLECLRLAGLENLLPVQVEDVLVFLADEPADRLRDQRPACNSEHSRNHQIGLQDLTLLACREIARRRQLIKVAIQRLRRIKLQLRTAQILVLRLQFDLVRVQFLCASGDLALQGCIELAYLPELLRQRLPHAAEIVLQILHVRDGAVAPVNLLTGRQAARKIRTDALQVLQRGRDFPAQQSG